MYFLLPVKFGILENVVLTIICLALGGCLYVVRLSICSESCAAEQVFDGRHVVVAFPFFHNSFVSGDNSRMVW